MNIKKKTIVRLNIKSNGARKTGFSALNGHADMRKTAFFFIQ